VRENAAPSSRTGDLGIAGGGFHVGHAFSFANNPASNRRTTRRDEVAPLFQLTLIEVVLLGCRPLCVPKNLDSDVGVMKSAQDSK
jgi:hypothetical protein